MKPLHDRAKQLADEVLNHVDFVYGNWVDPKAAEDAIIRAFLELIEEARAVCISKAESAEQFGLHQEAACYDECAYDIYLLHSTEDEE